MYTRAADISRCLAQNAEAACRYYLSAGRRHGNYWLVGDVNNNPGQSLYVRLTGPDRGPGCAGNWSDAATQERGDLLDLIRLNRGFRDITEAMDEARAFLALPQAEPTTPTAAERAPAGSSEAARRLFSAGQPLANTHAASYLGARGVTPCRSWASLRFHPTVYYREDRDAPLQSFPALLAAVTDREGRVEGVHRTWLHPSQPAKAPVDTPRRALGCLLGNGVRFGSAGDMLVAGEGLETTLSVVMALPGLPAIAALSAHHLAALDLPPTLTRLYVAVDNDPEGRSAFAHLAARHPDLDLRALTPAADDFNTDLQAKGRDALRASLIAQLAPSDADRMLESTKRLVSSPPLIGGRVLLRPESPAV
jgi:hypothetical protein